MIASDGSGGNPRIAGYAAVVYLGSNEYTVYKGAITDREIIGASLDPANRTMMLTYSNNQCNATNNRGELCGLLCSILIAKYMGKSGFTSIMDSQYCIKIFTEYLADWISRGIVGSKKNPDLVTLIAKEMEGLDVTFIHQKAHITKKAKDSLPEYKKLYVTLNEIADVESGKARSI